MQVKMINSRVQGAGYRVQTVLCCGRRILFAFSCLLFAGFCLRPFPAHAGAVSSSELISKAKQYDKATVQYEGELIGDILSRGEFAWLNIHDGENAIGVWARRSMLGRVKLGGGYEQVGDTLNVTGIFNRSCREHGGGLDIHAQNIVLVKEGARIYRHIEQKKIMWLGLLLGVLACMLTIHLLQAKQRAR